jgi:hypothetical protein
MASAVGRPVSGSDGPGAAAGAARFGRGGAFGAGAFRRGAGLRPRAGFLASLRLAAFACFAVFVFAIESP